MWSAVWRGGESIALEEGPVPTPRDDEVLVRVAACGICGTDIHIIEGKFPIYGPPRVLGHEYAGTVAAIGPTASRVRVGERVAVEPGLTCGKCPFCRIGKEHLCQARFVHPGGFAEYTMVPERLVHRLPDDLPLEIGAMAEPVACCLRAIDLAGLPSGCTALVLGGGAIGIMLAQLALRSGAAAVLVAEPRPHRRAIAETVGAVALDPGAGALAAAVREGTDGLGPEVVFEAVGHPALLEQAIGLVRRGGTVVLVGVAAPEAEARISPYLLFEKELTLRGSFMRPHTFSRAIAWLPRLDLRPLLGLTFPLQATLEALRAHRDGRGMKILVTP